MTATCPRPRRGAVTAVLIAMLGVQTLASSGERRSDAVHGSSGRAPLTSVQRWTAPPVDVPRLLQEDGRDLRRPGVPRRVGYPMRADLSPADSGTWEELNGGDRVWRLVLHSPGALWTVVGLDRFRLQPGGRLLVHDPAGITVLGPYTSDDVREHGQLWFPPVAGDSVVLAVEWPAALSGVDPDLHVGTVSHGYKAWGGLGDAAGSEAEDEEYAASEAGLCNVDVNCPAGDDWQDQKRGVVQLLTGGYAFCTGSLINNTTGDCRPYVLTAAHCGAGPSTTVRFNYERPACENGLPPADQTLTGATVVADYAASDFTLLELDQQPPEEYDVFFNGWRRSSLLVTRSSGIHHPSGDVKKISQDDDRLLDGLYWGSSHWRVADWEVGTTEPGSSGSPLFDAHGRIVGQLHGGTASCADGGWDEYGKLSFSWQGGGTPATRLSDWLDPLGIGALTLDGLDGSACQAPRPELLYAGHAVDDAAEGNGNGLAEPGETITLRIRVANEGDLAASDVAGTLAVASPWIELLDSGAEWPGIGAESEAETDPPAFTVRIDPSWSCGAPIGLELSLTAAESPGTWSVSFQLPTGSSDTVELFADDLEGDLAAWSVETPLGSSPWESSSIRSSSPLRSWFVGDSAGMSESLLYMPTLADLPEASVLRFAQFMISEEGSDGGVLEYSVGGATWYDAGPLIVEGGYNGTIHPSQATVLSQRPAWTGDLEGWRAVVGDLSTLAGSDVTFRWRFATDASVGAEGWYVDDVVVYAEEVECEPVGPELPGEPSAPAGAATPFRIAVEDGGYLMTWGEPESGGPVADYSLYSLPIAAAWSTPVCAGGLGSGTSSLVPSLPDDSAFLVVARNAAGEGPYGADSAGAPRTPASATVCP